MEGLGLEHYFKNHADLVTKEIVENATDLISRVEGILAEIGYKKPVVINSGYRSPEHNEAIGGKLKSYHTLGKAIDLGDQWHEIYKTIVAFPELLTGYGLWMEDGKSTPTWVHLDTGTRLYRPIRIFKP